MDSSDYSHHKCFICLLSFWWCDCEKRNFDPAQRMAQLANMNVAIFLTFYLRIKLTICVRNAVAKLILNIGLIESVLKFDWFDESQLKLFSKRTVNKPDSLTSLLKLLTHTIFNFSYKRSQTSLIKTLPLRYVHDSKYKFARSGRFHSKLLVFYLKL